MRQTHLIAVVVGSMASVMLAEDAFGRARTYNPSLGRFMQRDPVGTPLASPLTVSAQPTTGRSVSPPRFTQRDTVPTQQYTDGMSLYQYVAENPVTYTDPSGQLKFVWDLAKKYSPCLAQAFSDALADRDAHAEEWKKNGYKMWHCDQACRALYCLPCKNARVGLAIVGVGGLGYEICTAIGIGDPSFDGQTFCSWALDTPGDLIANSLGVAAWLRTSDPSQCVRACMGLGANLIPGPPDTVPLPKM